MSLLNSIQSVQLSAGAGSRIRFDQAGRFVVQVTGVEEFETRKMKEHNAAFASLAPEERVKHEKRATRLSFNVLEIEEHDEQRDRKTGAVLREAGKATSPAPGTEPEYALFPDEYGISVRTLKAFLKANQRLTVNQVNALTAEQVKEWINDGSLTDVVMRVDFVGKPWKGTTYYNPVSWEYVDPKKLSKAAKGKML